MISCVIFTVPWCLMCAKVKDDLLMPYVKKGIISLTVCRVGISSMLPAELSPEIYDYNFLYSETKRAITPTVCIEGKVFLQAMTFKEFEKTFSEELRRVMSHA